MKIKPRSTLSAKISATFSATLPAALLPTLMLLNTPGVEAKSDLPHTIKPKIVGGEVAQENEWPWMSALVATFDSISASLTVNGADYDTDAFNFTPSGDVSGELIACGIGDSTCEGAENKICLIERGEINFSVKAENCEASGGLGVVIYNNVEGRISGTLGEDFAGTIPVVGVTQADGQTLLTEVGTTAQIIVASNAVLAQDSSCGASFLGDKWVLTAAHCVDSPNSINMKVNVGEYDLRDGAENAVDIKRIYIHPDYSDEGFNNDIAILELEESVEGTAVTLADAMTTDQYAADNSTTTVSGWGGRTGYAPGDGPTSDFPDVLHTVDLQLFSNQQCREILSESYGGVPLADTGVTENMICAGTMSGGKGSCQGDSGGPLMINTGTGWEQVGIVSFGAGCAAAGYPGVFARVAPLTPWLQSIYQGVAITPKTDFSFNGQGTTATIELDVVNNSGQDATVSYTLDGNAAFTMDASSCESLTANQVCKLEVTYQPTTAGKHSASIVMNSDNAAIKTSYATLSGQSLTDASSLANATGGDSDITWFTGGNADWMANDVESGVKSGSITHLQSSALMASIEGEGKLTFDWSVSSEENTDDANDPFDTLYLYVNGQLYDFISGDVDWTTVEIDLPEGNYNFTWSYEKDPAATELEDTGYLRNVNFEKVEPPVVEPTPMPIPPPERQSSGGTTTLLGLFVLSMFGIRRFRQSK